MRSTLIASFPMRTNTILIIEIKIVKLLNVFKFYLSLSLSLSLSLMVVCGDFLLGFLCEYFFVG